MRPILLSLLLFSSLLSFSQTKRAFLVAISDYDDFTSWKRISSVEDLPYIKAGLRKFEFDDRDIDTLKNEAATKAGILRGLDMLANRSGPGDIVVFFFCGHGQQVMDNNGQPDEFDGYDEALVPYEAPGQYDPINNTGQLHLRDDELFPKLKAIHDKIGENGSLLVLIDACHSGTATRADAFMIARGSPRPLAPDDYVPNISLELGQRSKGFSEDRTLENMIVISASGPDQLNYQTRDEKGKNIGVLSYAFAKTCFELKPGDSYELMFEKIKARIQSNKPSQIPMMEGNGKREIFGSRFTKSDDIVSVNASNWVNDTTFIVEQGYLHSLTQGSRFHIAELGKTDVVARGYLARVEAMQSYGVVAAGVSRKEGYAVVMDELMPDDMQAMIYLRPKGIPKKREEQLTTELTQRMKPYPWIRQGNPADMMVELSGSTSDTVRLIDNSGKVLMSEVLLRDEPIGDERWKRMLMQINADTRIRYLRDLPDGGSLAKGIYGGIESSTTVKDSLRNEFVFTANDEFTIVMENKGSRKLYFNLINITPGNQISLLLPASGLTAGQCQILPRNVYRTPALKISKGTPSGKEVFKIILSEQPFDLGPVIRKLNRENERAVTNPLEKLFVDMYNEENVNLAKKRDMSKLAIDKMGVVTIGYSVK